MMRKGLIYLLYLLLSAEMASRGFLALKGYAPFDKPQEIIFYFYPELLSVSKQAVRNDDAVFDVLLLGGSVLDPCCGDIPDRLHSKLEHQLGTPVRIFNLAKPAQNSLDAFYKYSFLKKQSFDLVLFYESINEVRVNNCSDDFFREDYSHIAWYAKRGNFYRHPELPFFALPFTLELIRIAVIERFFPHAYMTREREIPEVSASLGGHIKSGAAYQKHLEEMISLSRQRGEKFLLMTYAFFIPPHYSRAAFAEKKLDYGSHLGAIEDWGKPENVAATITAHNEIIRKIADQNKDVIFVDQDKLMPRGGRYFDDICHLTRLGCEAFTEFLLKAFQNTSGTISKSAR